MMTVASISPKMMSAVCVFRRGMLRSPFLNITGLRKASQPRMTKMRAVIANMIPAIRFMETPNSSFMSAS